LIAVSKPWQNPQQKGEQKQNKDEPSDQDLEGFFENLCPSTARQNFPSLRPPRCLNKEGALSQ